MLCQLQQHVPDSDAQLVLTQPQPILSADIDAVRRTRLTPLLTCSARVRIYKSMRPMHECLSPIFTFGCSLHRRYVTEEGCLDDPAGLNELLYTSLRALRRVAPLPALWSPGFCRKFNSLPSGGAVLEAELETMFCSANITSPVAVHFQDLCTC